MLDMLRILLCGAGVLYLAFRIGVLVRTVVGGYRMATTGNVLNDHFDHSAGDRSAEPAIAAK